MLPETHAKEKLINDVLFSLRDGEWHDVTELIGQISPVKLEKVLVFFAKYDFIVWDQRASRVKLDRLIVKLF
jgi:hypothetical protein